MRFRLPLVYLASPVLPIGAYAWSQGLAGAVESGMIRNGGELKAWLAGVLEFGLGRFDLPLLARCFRAAGQADAAALAKWNDLVLAGRETAELWEEERRLGEALCRFLFGQGLWPVWAGDLALGHVAAFALAAETMATGSGGDGLMPDLLPAFAWSWLENQVAAAARILPLGQTEGSRSLISLMPTIEKAAGEALVVPDDRIGSSLPGLALASMAHEGQYSRLFRS